MDIPFPPPPEYLPLIRVQDLPKDERIFFIKMIRAILGESDLYKHFSNAGFGIEHSEELVIDLVDKGYVRIVIDKIEDVFYLQTWDGEKYN